jgi:hypothetical protein
MVNAPRWLLVFAGALAACDGGDATDAPVDTDTVDTETPGPTWDCVIPAGTEPDFAQQLGCRADFDVLASAPLDASIPGARSAKTLIDRVDGDALYFSNSKRYPIHYNFASAFLSGDGLPFITDLAAFNTTEYYAPDRRFLLGAITWYEEPGVWVYEIAPYDTSSDDMITAAYRKIAENSYFGDDLYFHPTSEAVGAVAAALPEDVKQISTDELFAGITYQPLNLGTTMGQLRFYRSTEVEDYVNYREIVVLDAIPNDISVVAATITGEFQTPLAHINVLAQNRGTPNMALKGAYDDERLRAFEGKWVELTVDALEYTIREVTEAEADAWWEANRPQPLEIGPMDTTVTGLWDCADIVDLDLPLGEALDARVPALGGKATNMSALVQIGPAVPVPPCFATPVHYYNEHMTRNGLWARYAELTMDPGWGDAQRRAELLRGFQQEVEDAPLDPDFLALVMDKIDADFDRRKMRFRSSTNAEDLGNFSGAGLYTSKSGDWDDEGLDIADAITDVWGALWSPRAWEEREYWGIDHTRVGMAMLSNPAYDFEEANGVAITGNIYDTAGLEPAFYINVQTGENSVVLPEPGHTTDQILYYFTLPGQPVVYIGHSNLVPAGEAVMTNAQLYELGAALQAVHEFFYPAYGAGGGFYAMDTEFKVVDGHIELKQARPYPGWRANP